MESIVPINKVNSLAKFLLGKKIVIAGGCFDILHIGHVEYLNEAKKTGDVLVVLLESDNSIKKIKGITRPINPQKNRAKILSELKPVDYIICLSEFGNSDYDKLIFQLKPQIIATTFGDKQIEHKIRQANMIGAKVVIVNKKIKDQSTSKIADIISWDI